nr:PREDICTED: zinc finger SWIM domain-containing protein 3 isoform X2 [Latimeria chalumnae]|eukprot:XP_014342371.1 PREDICTED: zinc finger SWIM domain-containing protein 3 isoform X2 [Latimeria chalumnae]
MKVKYGCMYHSQKPKYGKKRKKHHPSKLCTAYFLLQFNEKLDRLVVTESNQNHAHVRKSRSGKCIQEQVSTSALSSEGVDEWESSLDSAPVTANNSCRADLPGTASTAAPGPEGNQNNPSISGNPQNPPIVTNPVPQNTKMCLERLVLLGTIDVLTDKLKQNTTNSALHKVAEAVQEFLNDIKGSMASIGVGSSQDLERVSLQTPKMRSFFVNFPESLLLHRMQSRKGHVLYAFLVEANERAAKVVHLAALKEDTAENVTKMLTFFKEFNPEWRKVNFVFTDNYYENVTAINEAFPSAQVLLSVFHTYDLIEEKIHQKSMDSVFLNSLTSALENAVLYTSVTKLVLLSELLKNAVDEEFYEYLKANWFSSEMLWHFHLRKGLPACSTYMDTLRLVTHKMSSLFGSRLSFKTCVLILAKQADCFNANSVVQVENNSENMSNGSQINRSKAPASSVEVCDMLPSGSVMNSLSVLPGSTSYPDEGSPVEVLDEMQIALLEICNEVAARFCMNEWEVAKKSSQLIKVTEQTIDIQLLEEAHQVSKDFKRCSCRFGQKYRLPCRHILSILHANKRVVEEEMVSKRWQKRYQRVFYPDGHDYELHTILRHNDTPKAADEKYIKIKSLTEELGNLLIQGEAKEFEERFSTLKMIADIWTKTSSETELDANYTPSTMNENLGLTILVKREQSDAEPVFIKQEAEPTVSLAGREPH